MSTRSSLDRAEISLVLREAAECYGEGLRGALGENLVSVVLFGSVDTGDMPMTLLQR